MAGWFEDYQREKDDEAARRGAEEAKNEGILGSMLHEVSDLLRDTAPVGFIPKDSEERSREHAYHTTPKGWERESKSKASESTTANSSSDSYHGGYGSSSSNPPTTGESIGMCVGMFLVGWLLTGLLGCTVLVVRGYHDPMEPLRAWDYAPTVGKILALGTAVKLLYSRLTK
jgi:hypothetical protein